MNDDFDYAILGGELGALIGGGLGLGTCVWIIEGTLLFPGDTIIAGALICGTLGFFHGEGFIEWLKENWWWFWQTVEQRSHQCQDLLEISH